MWQRCPVCCGTGRVPSTVRGSSSISVPTEPCPTCLGHRIISEATGRPPYVERAKVPFQIDGLPATTRGEVP